jgi:hypothetical protein
MLTPEPHVPHILRGEVRGVRGGVLWGMTHPGLATVDLWAQDADRRNMARVVLDRQRIAELRVLLDAMEAAIDGQAGAVAPSP